MKKLLCALIASASILLTNGCASMFGDNTRQVVVNSKPEGADIYIDGINRGSTPAVLSLPVYIYNGQTVVLKKDGYKDTAVYANSKFQFVGLWNILNFPIGFIIDAADGQMMKIDPINLNMTANMSPVSKH